MSEIKNLSDVKTKPCSDERMCIPCFTGHGDCMYPSKSVTNLVSAAMWHAEENCAHAFLVQVPNTNPKLFVALGERSQLSEMAVPVKTKREQRDAFIAWQMKENRWYLEEFTMADGRFLIEEIQRDWIVWQAALRSMEVAHG